MNVTHSTATVQIHANGSATWVVTNQINASAATRVSADPALLDRIARTAASEGWGLPHVYEEGTVMFQSASVNDRTVRFRFRDPDAGERHLDVLVVDYLHSGGIQGGWIHNANRFTLIGPSGTVVVNDPRATINQEYTSADSLPVVTDGQVTWRGSTSPRHGTVSYDDVYIAYGPPGTSTARVNAAITLATVPIWLDNVQAFVVPAVVVYGVLLAVVTGIVRGATDASFDGSHIGHLIAGLGFGGTVGAVLAGILDRPSWFAGLAVIYLVTGYIALARPAALRSIRGALGVALLCDLAVGLVLLGIGLGDRAFSDVTIPVLRGMVVHLPLAVAPAFGLAVVRTGDRDNIGLVLLAFGGALASFMLAGMVFVPFDSRPFGLIILFTIGGAILAALFGLPLAILAARGSRGDDSPREST